MRRTTKFGAHLLGLGALAIAACAAACSAVKEEPGSPPPPAVSVKAAELAAPAPGEDDINPRLLRRFQPLPSTHEAPSKELVDLGRMLFFDGRLSKTGTLSCNSCHELGTYGVDGQRTSAGHQGKAGTRNAPSVYNAAGHFLQFWDGRAKDVEAQAKMPILNPAEMAMPDPAAVVRAVHKISGYGPVFRRAFPGQAEPITFDNVGVAIGAFERGLVTPGRWDAFLRGERHALSAQERVGLKTFLNAGCMVCHTGTHLGGTTFERAGLVEPWPNQADQGRGTLTGVPGDSMMFKVPSLRNVAKTGPYFHDGSGATLEEAVRMMGRHQLGVDLTPEEITSIVTWLGSLTSPLPPAEYIAKPELPAE